jgi:hypothetical protein
VSAEALRERSTRLDWVEELLYLSILATEACILHPWQSLIHTLLGYDPLPLWALVALLWLAYVAASLVSHSKLGMDRRQALVAGLVLLSALVVVRLHLYPGRPIWDLAWIGDMVQSLFEVMSVVPADLLLILLTLVAWWRSLVASRHEADIQGIWYRFRVGVLLLLAYLVVAAFGTHPDATGLLFSFFFFGLMSVALARILELGGIHSSTMGSRQWVGVLVGAILGNLALAFLAALIFSQQVVRTVLSWFQPLFRLVQRALWILFALLAYLLWPLMEMLLNWARNVMPVEFSIFGSPLLSPLATPQEIAEQAQTRELPRVCSTLIVLTLVVGGLFLVTLAIRRLSARRDAKDRDERESLWSTGDLVQDLKDGFLRAVEQLRNLGQGGDRKRRSAASIRKIYASVVDLAEEAGYPRDQAETPYEHVAVLYQAFPGGEGAVDAITHAYVRVHYGEVPGSEQEMAEIRAHYEALQELVKPKESLT